MGLLHLLEPEEFIGGLWHDLVGKGSQVAHFPDEAVRYDELARRLSIIFHGLGGSTGAEIKAAAPEVSHHRLGLRFGLGRRSERVGRARYDGDRLLLPDMLDLLPTRRLNESLYIWLVAWTATAQPPEPLPRDPWHADLARIAHAQATERRVLATFPGLALLHRELAAAALAVRPERTLPAAEMMIETHLRARLAAAAAGRHPDAALPDAAAAPGQDYRTYLPNPLWAEIDPPQRRQCVERGDEDDPAGSRAAPGDEQTRKGTRRRSDVIERKGALIVHRFEKILTWTEFMNIHREVEDDEEDAARKAADDHDEIGVTQLKRKAATRLKFDLDLAPGDVALETLSAAHVYPEWDYRRRAYHAAHVRVLEHATAADTPASPPDVPASPPDAPAAQWQPDAGAARRIRAVRRQFEALRPRREQLPRQLDGAELDMDALIRARADLAADGHGSDRIYRQAREQARDLSVAVLVDVSRSTESGVGDRAVIEVEKEALVALAEGLAACGDACAIYAFSSLRRDRVFINRLKSFDEAIGPPVRDRIAALKPGFYTRLGGAIRHTSAALSARPTRKRLLLVLTDGKPNDLDHYDGRYGIEDSRRAVLEAREAGHAVFGMTVDNTAQSYFPRIFGARAFAILSRPDRLTMALPQLYRHLVQ